MDGVFLSVRDQQRFRYIEDFRTGRLTRQETSLKLDVSERTVSRMARKVRGSGLKGVKHRNYGRVPHNKISLNVMAFYVELYRGKYAKFNFSHALEQILANETPPQRVSYDVFRKWCRAAGLGKIKRRRRSKAHYRRERASNEGIMIQLDGSPHKWNGEDEWTAITTIDDATSDVPSSKFFESETTWGCMEVMQRLIESKGIPEFVLTDCAGWSTGSLKRQNFSQFVRACDELDIKVIGTPSPETKGRIERLNRTMQDRLIPELDLLGIKGMTDANRYLDQVFLPDLRKRIGVEPVAPETRYRKIPAGVDLREVFCMKFNRIVNRDHTVQFETQRYLLRYDGVGSLWKHQIEIRRYQNEEISFFYGGCRLVASIVRQIKRRVWSD